MLANQRGFWDQNCPGGKGKLDLHSFPCSDEFYSSFCYFEAVIWAQTLQAEWGSLAMAVSPGWGDFVLCVFHLGLSGKKIRRWTSVTVWSPDSTEYG